MDVKLSLVSTVQTLVDDNEEDIFTDITNNPGTNLADVITRTAIASAIVTGVLTIMESQNLVRIGRDLNGGDFYWTAEDWASLIRNNRVAARTWAAANDGGLISAMAVSLSVHEAVAVSLADFMRSEARVVITVV